MSIFAVSSKKMQFLPSYMSVVTGPIFIKIAQNVPKVLPFNICKSELRYSNSFQNASMLNEDQVANFVKNW